MLPALKLIMEIIHLGSLAYGAVEDRALARRNQELDEKIRKLEAEIAEMKKDMAKANAEKGKEK